MTNGSRVGPAQPGAAARDPAGATLPAGRTLPTEDELWGYLETLSNWGRWGDDDELGTLNLITPAKRLEAVATVREGTSVGCARPILVEQAAADVRFQPQHFMIKSGEAAESTGAADYMGFAPHGHTISHVDTLAHHFSHGKMYGGRPMRLVTTAEGATACSVETMKDGIVTRGVLLDIARLKGKPYLDAGEPIFPDELEAAERMHGVRVAEGDALLVRTGWSRRREELGPYPIYQHRPGLHAATLPWLRERGVAVLAGDAAQDVVPSGYESIPGPIHKIGIVAMGLCLMDNLQFEDLVTECERLGRWGFLFMVAPLRVRYGTASPTTPLALF